MRIKEKLCDTNAWGAQFLMKWWLNALFLFCCKNVCVWESAKNWHIASVQVALTGILKFTYFEIFKIYAPHMTRDQNLHFYHRSSRKILKYILTIFMELAKGISRIIYGKHFRIILLCFALINLSSSCKCFISIIRDGACCSRKEKSGANAVLGAPSVKTRAGKILAETEKSFSRKKFSFTKAKIFVFQ